VVDLMIRATLVSAATRPVKPRTTMILFLCGG